MWLLLLRELGFGLVRMQSGGNVLSRILVLTTTYPYESIDPQPGFVKHLSEGLSKDNEVWVLAPSIDGRPSINSEERVKVNRYRYFVSYGERLCGGDGILENLRSNRLLFALLPFMFVAQCWAAIRLVRKHRIEVLHAHWIIPQGLVAVLVSKFSSRKLKILVTSHGGDLFALNGRIPKLLKRFVLKRADLITVVSDAMKHKCISEFSLASNKIVVAPMGVDLHHTFVPSGAKQARRLVFVGRLAEKKGVDILLQAMAELAKTQKFRIDIIGGGAKLAFYRNEVLKLGLSESVFFHGAIANHLLVPYLQQATIGVFPFRVAEDGDQEGLGLTMVEAMGCECAVVASDLSAVRDVVVDGVTGHLIANGSALSFAENISALLSSPESASKLGQDARLFVLSKFDWRSVAAQYSEIVRLL